MKTLFLIFSLAAFGCSSGNNITEVGNPTTVATTTNGTTQALTNTVNGLLGSVSGEALIKGVKKKNMREGNEESADGEEEQATEEDEVETEDDYSCLFSEDGTSLVCDCPNGGTITETFEDSFSETEDEVTLNSIFTVEFADCVVSSCGEDITLNGEVSGTFDGAIDFITEEVAIEVNYGTEEECSGLTSNSTTIGFEITLTTDGSTEEVFGTFCVDDEIIEFDSIEELEQTVDPENACEV